ncbi:MAG: ABC transporter ATP-binding protein [Acholeplasmataceae bacterium]
MGYLEIKDVIIDYGIIRAVKGVSMTVPENSIVAILGSNGAGKTTLIRSISGLVKVAEGSISLDGELISNKEPYKIAAKGILQSPEGRLVLRGLTVEDNLLVGAYALKSKDGLKRNARIKKLFDNVFELFPILKERRKQQASTLSGGEQQMLAIGRALMGDPDILLLDEPSLGLAPLIVRSIFEVLVKIRAAGKTILIVEQNAFQTLKIADYAYVLELGKIKLEGKAADLLANDELVNAYLGKNN